MSDYSTNLPPSATPSLSNEQPPAIPLHSSPGSAGFDSTLPDTNDLQLPRLHPNEAVLIASGIALDASTVATDEIEGPTIEATGTTGTSVATGSVAVSKSVEQGTIGAGDGASTGKPLGAESGGSNPAQAEQPTLIDSLAAAAVSGDMAARDRLMTEIHPVVLRYCKGRLGTHNTVTGSAEDVAQEVCLAVVSALPHYTVAGLSFRAFVYGIAAHKVTDVFRAIGRNRSDPTDEFLDIPDTDQGPEQRALDTAMWPQLYRLLDHLTPRQREILVLRIAVGLSARETAEAVGTSSEAVRVAQHRALNKLRGIMASEGSGPHLTIVPDL